MCQANFSSWTFLRNILMHFIISLEFDFFNNFPNFQLQKSMKEIDLNWKTMFWSLIWLLKVSILDYFNFNLINFSRLDCWLQHIFSSQHQRQLVLFSARWNKFLTPVFYDQVLKVWYRDPMGQFQVNMDGSSSHVIREGFKKKRKWFYY